MELKKGLISVIIVSWNGEHLLKSHFDSICSQKKVNYEIIIIDNNSEDNTKKLIEEFSKKYPNLKIKYIFSPTNTGTALGSNLGIEHAEGEFIFWISNDMEFDKLCLHNLYNKIANDEKCGICTPRMNKLIDGHKTNIVDSIGGELDFLANPMSIGINEEYKETDFIEDKIFFSYGGALFIRTDLAKYIKGFDERYFTLGDDIDLSWRVQLQGYNVLSVKEAFLYHRVSATLSHSTNREKRRYLSERNNFCSILKNYNIFTLFLVVPLYFLIIISEMLFYLFKLKPNLAYSIAKAILWNLFNIKETLRKRSFIQKNRNISDLNIIRNMRIFPIKIYYFYDYVKNSKKDRWKYFFN